MAYVLHLYHSVTLIPDENLTTTVKHTQHVTTTDNNAEDDT